jgi:MFS family permease
LKELRFIVSIFLVFVGDHILLFALPLLVFNTTQSISAAGLAYFIEWLPRVLFLPFGGYLTDRFGSKNSLISIDLFKIIACLIVCLLLVANSHWNIAITIGILGSVCSLGTSQTAIAADVLLMKNTEINKYSKVVTYLNMSDQVSMLIGPAIAIFLVSYLPIKYFLLIVPIFYIYNLFNTLTQNWKDGFTYCPGQKQQESFLSSFKSMILVFKKFPILLLFSLQASVINFIISIVEAAGAPLVKLFFQKGDAEFGLLNIIAGLFGALSMIIISYVINEKRAFYISFFGALGLLISSYLCILSNGFYLFIIFYGFIIVFTLINSLFARILRKTLVEASLLGNVTGMMMAINQISVPLAGLAISFIASLEGMKAIILYSTNVLVLVFIICFCFSYKYRNLDKNTKEYSKKIEGAVIT